MSEAEGIYQPMPGMFRLYVPDVDTAYRRRSHFDIGAVRPVWKRWGEEPIRQPVVFRAAAARLTPGIKPFNLEFSSPDASANPRGIYFV